MAPLLDQSVPFSPEKVALLDIVVSTFYNSPNNIQVSHKLDTACGRLRRVGSVRRRIRF